MIIDFMDDIVINKLFFKGELDVYGQFEKGYVVDVKRKELVIQIIFIVVCVIQEKVIICDVVIFVDIGSQKKRKYLCKILQFFNIYFYVLWYVIFIRILKGGYFFLQFIS